MSGEPVELLGAGVGSTHAPEGHQTARAFEAAAGAASSNSDPDDSDIPASSDSSRSLTVAVGAVPQLWGSEKAMKQ